MAGKADTKLIADMNVVRTLSSKGLEARTVAKINVRQPLTALKVKDQKIAGLHAQLLDLVKDEVNVKGIIADASIEKDVELDIAITPELKEEGALRELIRSIQDLRKEKGLSVGDKAAVIVPVDQKMIAEKYADEIKKVTNVTNISFGDKLSL